MDVETTGYVLRLCPFESLAFSGVTLTDDDLETFIEVCWVLTSKLTIKSSTHILLFYRRRTYLQRESTKLITFQLYILLQGLETQTSILNATVCQRDRFIDLIGQEVKLEHIEIAHWAGLGGVSYLPPEFRLELEEVEVLVEANQIDIPESSKERQEGESSVRPIFIVLKGKGACISSISLCSWSIVQSLRFSF